MVKSSPEPQHNSDKLIKILLQSLFEEQNLKKSSKDEILEFLKKLKKYLKKHKRKFICNEVKIKICELLMLNKNYRKCLRVTKKLVKKLKKIDDKIKLITLYVIESKVYYSIKNSSKAKSALTSARALALGLYNPKIMSEIDMRSGMYSCDDRSYLAATAYFLEALDISKDYKNNEYLKCLSYLILCKIILKKFEEINGIFENKNYRICINEKIIEFMMKIKKSCENKNLKSFNELLSENYEILDDFLKKHLEYLYDLTLNANILKIVKPYSQLKIQFIADKLNFDKSLVENKLRLLILDGKIHGNIDQSMEALIISENVKDENIVEARQVDKLLEFTENL
ncbi:unnamed protein product [Dimorphilus gyrociliatus]|uniref:PCI domain-containing protein n=1 Tax=Dimorphilus gyrociliatus TaxID=2664684 RepID=A0A7I8WF24_9ANNE|nr:unnamed protein product [Dimorphilus gyrociliatus]